MFGRLLHEHYQNKNSTFIAAHDGYMKGDNFSKCLLGSFIAPGIGMTKNMQKKGSN